MSGGASSRWGMGMGTGVFLAGNRLVFRAGLARILERDQFVVTGEGNGVPPELPPGTALLIVDGAGSVTPAAECVRAAKDAAPTLRTLIIAGHTDADGIARAFAAGTDGFLFDSISPEALTESLRLIMLGEHVLPSQAVALLREMARPPALERIRSEIGLALSEREAEIILMLADGMPNKVIAAELAITEATVKVHLKSIMKKLGCTNRTQAAVWAISNGLSRRMPAA